MEKLDINTNEFGNETAKASEKRRELRKSLEKGTATPNKFTLNDLMLAFIVAVAMVLSYTDFTLSLGNFKNFTALTLFLYVVTTIIYRNRYNRGKARGRSDTDYCDALKDYRSSKKKIIDFGFVSDVPLFCREYKVRELKEYRTSILADVDLEYDEYFEKYRRMKNRKIMRLKLPWDMRRAIIKCNRAKPLRLTPGLIMNENGEAGRDKLLSQSGREREKKDKRRDFIRRGVMVILGGAIAVNIILDFSVITIVQWFVRMLPVMSAIIMGDDAGFCDITVTETNFKHGQTSVINLFLEYENNKMNDNEIAEAPSEIDMTNAVNAND
jgi:hypothetical protein